MQLVVVRHRNANCDRVLENYAADGTAQTEKRLRLAVNFYQTEVVAIFW